MPSVDLLSTRVLASSTMESAPGLRRVTDPQPDLGGGPPTGPHRPARQPLQQSPVFSPAGGPAGSPAAHTHTNATREPGRVRQRLQASLGADQQAPTPPPTTPTPLHTAPELVVCDVDQICTPRPRVCFSSRVCAPVEPLDRGAGIPLPPRSVPVWRGGVSL